MVEAADDPARALARRLRQLREQEWAGVRITQHELGRALSPERPVSVPLISSWESENRPVVPPDKRLAAYANLFASRRAVERNPFQPLRDDELTDAERARRDELNRELQRLAGAVRGGGSAARDLAVQLLGGPWSFQDSRPVTMVCAELPAHQQERLPKPDDPEGGYAELYAYADLDALFELHGHIRAANPASFVALRASSQLQPDDYTAHLVVLGGVDWNLATRNLLRFMPMAQQRAGGPAGAYFDVEDRDGHRELHADLAADGALLADVAHFFRAPNPFNRKRTVTICNGLSGRGVYGAVRALTDERFRDRNAEYLSERFGDSEAYSIMMRVEIIDGRVMTPDWTRSETRLHEWPENGA